MKQFDKFGIFDKFAQLKFEFIEDWRVWNNLKAWKVWRIKHFDKFGKFGEPVKFWELKSLKCLVGLKNETLW